MGGRECLDGSLRLFRQFMFTFYRELLCHNNDGTFGGWRVYVLAVKFNIRNMHDEISMKNDSE